MKILKMLVVVIASVVVCGAYTHCGFFTNDSSLPTSGGAVELPSGEGPGGGGETPATPLTVEEAVKMLAETSLVAVPKAVLGGYGIELVEGGAGSISVLIKDVPLVGIASAGAAKLVDPLLAGISCDNEMALDAEGVSGTILCVVPPPAQGVTYFFDIGSFPLCFDNVTVGNVIFNGCINVTIEAISSESDTNISVHVTMKTNGGEWRGVLYFPPDNPLTFTMLDSGDIFDFVFVKGRFGMSIVEGRLVVEALNLLEVQMWHRGDAAMTECYPPQYVGGEPLALESICITGDPCPEVCGDIGLESCWDENGALLWENEHQWVAGTCQSCSWVKDDVYEINCGCAVAVDPTYCACQDKVLALCVNFEGDPIDNAQQCSDNGGECIDGCCEAPCESGLSVANAVQGVCNSFCEGMCTLEDWSIDLVCYEACVSSCDPALICEGDCCAYMTQGSLVASEDGRCCVAGAGCSGTVIIPDMGEFPMPTTLQAIETMCEGAQVTCDACTGDCCTALATLYGIDPLLETQGECCAVIAD